jgi:hypothetical protein
MWGPHTDGQTNSFEQAKKSRENELYICAYKYQLDRVLYLGVTQLRGPSTCTQETVWISEDKQSKAPIEDMDV